jgi:hypothetical protein
MKADAKNWQLVAIVGATIKLTDYGNAWHKHYRMSLYVLP